MHRPSFARLGLLQGTDDGPGEVFDMSAHRAKLRGIYRIIGVQRLGA